MQQTNENEKQASKIPETSTTKPMDSKQDVANSNDAKTDQDFPGYPHYPAKEDIMDQRTDSHRVDADMENLTNSNNKTGVNERFPTEEQARNAMTPQPGLGTDDLNIKSGTEADVTNDDLVALNTTNGEIGVPQNVDGDDLNTDLDIPGTDLDDEAEAIGEEDEENNYYSLGGDRHHAQEEDPTSNPQHS